MIHPGAALLIALALAGATIVLLWPDRGLLWRGIRALRANERILTEDALKHLFDCEYKGRIATLQSLSGALAVSGNRAADLLRRLEEREFVTSANAEYRLTSEGRTYALRVIRIHRLWERYFSEETGMDPAVWHAEAEQLEHRTSPEQAEALSARLGHPRFDPHGDPIPTVKGEIEPPRGVPLPDLPIGELAEIVHIEDEPEAVYAQIVAEGLHPGMRVRVHEISPQRVLFEADAEEVVLAPVLAANLSVVPLPTEEAMEGPYEKLSSLDIGERARVLGISARCRGPERRRFLDLGVIPGTVIEVVLRSPGGDPTGYRIRGAVIALRSEQADHIQIEKLSEGAAA